MQKIGRKSIVVEMKIPNRLYPTIPYVVKIQANKNHGICNIIVETPTPNKEKTKERKVVTDFHDGQTLSLFQGRQYDDPAVISSLKTTLYESLNSERL